MGRRVAVVACLFGGLLLLTAAVRGQALAQEGGRAAVVVRFDDERTESRCVAFDAAEISGYALLQRSGLALDVKSEGQGGLVCAIEGTGCGVGNCLCQCKGDPCVYWSYWRMADEGWSYSPVGATVRKLSHGDVDGWSWGPGSVVSAIEPQTVSFDEICTGEATVYGLGQAANDTDGVEETTEWLPYVAFGLLAAGIGLAALVTKRRRQGS